MARGVAEQLRARQVAHSVNPPPQFSRLGTWCPTLLCATVSVYVYLGGGWGVEGDFWFSIIRGYAINMFKTSCILGIDAKPTGSCVAAHEKALL